MSALHRPCVRQITPFDIDRSFAVIGLTRTTGLDISVSNLTNFSRQALTSSADLTMTFSVDALIAQNTSSSTDWLLSTASDF
jgi:hypothetical protein